MNSLLSRVEIKVILFQFVCGFLDPLFLEEPSMAEDRVGRFKLRVDGARVTSRGLVFDATAADARQGESANPLT